MKENVGRVDRVGRFIAGPALMALGYRNWGGRDGEIGGLAAIVGGALVLESAVTRTCPLNALFGIDTRTREETERDFKTAVESPLGRRTQRALDERLQTPP